MNGQKQEISGGMLEDGKREISDYTSVIKGTVLSFLMERFIPASIMILT